MVEGGGTVRISDKEAELRELSMLHHRLAATRAELDQRLFVLNQDGFALKELAAVIGLSVSQVSRVIGRVREQTGDSPAADAPAATAMELVRRAQRGEIAHDRFVSLLKGWAYEPQYRTTSEADDWELVDNSFDAVEFAYMALDLIDDDEYAEIVSASA